MKWSGLSLAVGLALAEAVDPVADTGSDARPRIGQDAAASPPALPRIELKWPNDLWLVEGPGRGRKHRFRIETVIPEKGITIPRTGEKFYGFMTVTEVK